jgi:leader peptidase (prepilin peptidase) / N-methyltransferase
MIESYQLLFQQFPGCFTVFSFIFGSIVGSFLNVCIYRIPAERSLMFPGSTCGCGTAIAWHHNIPILSWILLRGRAACCGARFSPRYPAIELLTGLLFTASWLLYPAEVAIIGMLFIAFLICATFIDLDHMIIPDRFSVGGMLLGVILSFLFPTLQGVEVVLPVLDHIKAGVLSIIGALIGAGLVYWIAILGELVFRKPAMGEGDVKFVGFIGAFCGWQGAVFAMFGGALIGSAVLLPILLMARLIGKKTVETKSVAIGSTDDQVAVQFGSQVPFGPMLAFAGLIYFLGFDRYVDAYFADFTLSFFSR